MAAVLSGWACGEEVVEIGGGQFTPRHLTIQGAAVAAADLNADGHPDLVGAGMPELSVFLGNGRGALTLSSRTAGGDNPVAFAFGDLDGDGDLDLVVANHDRDHVTVLLGDGGGGLRPSSHPKKVLPVRPHPHDVKLADLDGDGHLDLLVDDREAEGVRIFPGREGANWEMPGRLVEVGGDPYRGMAVADFNRDGRLDLATPNPSEVAILLQTGEGWAGAVPFRKASVLAMEDPFAVRAGDFNGDGHLDILAAGGERSPEVSIHWGDGRGGFAASDAYEISLAPGGKNAVTGDFNGDGVRDAAVVCWGHREGLMILGGRQGPRAERFPVPGTPWGLAAADFNQDGRDDLVVSDGTGPGAVLFLSVSVR